MELVLSHLNVSVDQVLAFTLADVNHAYLALRGEVADAAEPGRHRSMSGAVKNSLLRWNNSLAKRDSHKNPALARMLAQQAIKLHRTVRDDPGSLMSHQIGLSVIANMAAEWYLAINHQIDAEPLTRHVAFSDAFVEPDRLAIATSAAETIQSELIHFADKHHDEFIERDARAQANILRHSFTMADPNERQCWDNIRAAGAFLKTHQPPDNPDDAELAELITAEIPADDDGSGLQPVIEEVIGIGRTRQAADKTKELVIDGAQDGVKKGVETIVKGLIVGGAASAVAGVTYLATRPGWVAALVRALVSVVKAVT